MKNIVINLELTSICNRKCMVCPQGDKDNSLIRKDMSLKDLNKFIERVKEAYNQKIFVREIINAGYGETFIHKKLKDVFERYKKLKEYFNQNYKKSPDISIVTNGGEITKEKLDIVSESLDILKFSFPTSDPEQYGLITYRCNEKGGELLKKATGNLKKCMIFYKDKKIPELRIHISPPVEHSHEHFPQTLDFLIKTAKSVNLNKLKIVIFPTTSNRAGSVKDENFLNNFYRDYMKRYNDKTIDGVKIEMLSEMKVFYPTNLHVLLILLHKFPCLWKGGSVSIDSSGNYRLCINDVFSKAKIGNLDSMSIKEAINKIKKIKPSINCNLCNQNPIKMGEDILQKIYKYPAKLRMKF